MLVNLVIYCIFLIFLFVILGDGGRAYADKVDKGRVGGVGQMLTLADKAGRVA